jgi:shikimate dehydrogenase
VYGLIGDPVDHSLSPAIQNAAFRASGLNAVYVVFPVRRPALRHAIQGLKSLGVKGFNVTTPHKTALLRYLDRVDTEAAEIGSINTVKSENDQLTGFNTDGAGALAAMEHAGLSIAGQTVFLLGAGGAANAVAHALGARDCSIILANRTTSRARRLAKSLRSMFGVEADFIPLSMKVMRDRLSQVDVILNASSMGMGSKNNPPIAKKWIRSDHWVFDIVYKPIQTKLLRDAISAGARTINGLEMLLNQGACSFTLWTGKKAPLRAMRRAIDETLENTAS